MKSTRIILMALCLTALTWGGTSCKKDKDIHNQGEKMTISAGIDQTSVGNTKTFLCPTASGVLVKWSAGEKFKLFGNGSTQGEEFVMVSGAGQQSAQFEGTVPAGGAPYFAAYPSNGTFNGSNTFTFAMPATIQYVAETKAGTSDNFISLQQHNAPMVGKLADGEKLQFHNAMSTIFLDLKGGAKITKIVLTDLSGNSSLNGTLTVTVDGEGKVASSTLAGGTSNLTLDLGDGVTLDKDKYSMFCFPVPEGAFAGAEGSKNVKIDIYDMTNTVIMTIEKGLQEGVHANGAYQVVENKVRPIVSSGEFTVNAAGVGTRTIYFTHGNLWYDGSEFHFEDEQWIASTNDWSTNHLGHFFWGNDVTTAVSQNGPSSMGGRLFTNLQTGSDSQRYKPNPNFTVEGQANKFVVIGFDDYGTLLARTSTVGSYGKPLWGMGTVNGVKGIILLPDTWNAKTHSSFEYGAEKCNKNNFTIDQWEDMEYEGAVFLPIAGYGDNGKSKISEALEGEYWSAFYSNGTEAAATLWFEDNQEPGTDWVDEDYWCSIRLVYYP